MNIEKLGIDLNGLKEKRVNAAPANTNNVKCPKLCVNGPYYREISCSGCPDMIKRIGTPH